jgi:hypothetical protein
MDLFGVIFTMGVMDMAVANPLMGTGVIPLANNKTPEPVGKGGKMGDIIK